MRLSEAILLGSMRYRLDPSSWVCEDGGCLLGIASKAVGSHWNVVAEVWPWLTAKEIPRPSFMLDLPKRFGFHSDFLGKVSLIWEIGMPFYIIQALALSAKAGDVSIEKIVDWVRSVEPAEEVAPVIESITEAVCA